MALIYIIYSYKYLEFDLIKHCHVIFIHSLGQPLIVRSHSKVHRSRGNPKENSTWASRVSNYSYFPWLNRQQTWRPATAKSYRYSNTWCPSKYYMYLITWCLSQSYVWLVTWYLSQNCMYSITRGLSQNYMYSITWRLFQRRRYSITWCLMQKYSI
jgi:hypothetical protein